MPRPNRRVSPTGIPESLPEAASASKGAATTVAITVSAVVASIATASLVAIRFSRFGLRERVLRIVFCPYSRPVIQTPMASEAIQVGRPTPRFRARESSPGPVNATTPAAIPAARTTANRVHLGVGSTVSFLSSDRMFKLLFVFDAYCRFLA